MFKQFEAVEKYGKKALGKAELLKHFDRKKITLRQAVKAKCYDCMGYYADGKVDCVVPHCPLYPFMVYKSGGLTKRIMTPKQATNMANLQRRASKKRAASKTKTKRHTT